jgi:O-antigen ligase
MQTDLAAHHPAPSAQRGWLSGICALVVIAGTALASTVTGGDFARMALIAAVVLALGVVAVSSPVVAAIALLGAMFLRVALTDVFPEDPFVAAFALLGLSYLMWSRRTIGRRRAPDAGIDKVQAAMVLFVLWNVYSMFAAHKYTAEDHLLNEVISVPRLIVTGTLIPFALYAVGLRAFDRESKVRALLWSVLAISAYSAAVSIMQFTGPTDLVWPRYIITGGEENWVGRAAGVLNQPVANGMILALGFAIAMVLVSRSGEHFWAKVLATAIAVACGVGLYLTYTRAAWLSAVVMLVLGVVMAKGYRRGFVAALALAVSGALVNWSLFTSSNREAGGIGSKGEVYDRLNSMKTALWAIEENPLAGWGIGRFQAVNTYHHQQWAPDVPWERGYGIVSHSNELGIAAELGLIGLALWLAVLGLIVYKLFRGFSAAPADSLCGRPLAMIAIIAVAIMLCSGLTVDLRFFDFAPAVVFLLAGVAVGWFTRDPEADPAADPTRRAAPVTREMEITR